MWPPHCRKYGKANIILDLSLTKAETTALILSDPYELMYKCICNCTVTNEFVKFIAQICSNVFEPKC
jgi:hypothetical protein